MSKNAARELTPFIGFAYYDRDCYEHLLEISQGSFHGGEPYDEWRQSFEREFEHFYRKIDGGAYLVPLSSSELEKYATDCKKPISNSLACELISEKLEKSSSVESEYAMSPEIALRRLNEFDGIYKRSAVDALLAQREYAEESLVQLLGDFGSNLQRYSRRENYMGHIYAGYLCAYWKIARVHERLVKCFNISDAERLDLWGDVVTESLPMLLVRTFDSNSRSMRELVMSEAVDEFIRNAALAAHAYLSRHGQIPAREHSQLCVDVLRAGLQYGHNFAREEALVYLLVNKEREALPLMLEYQGLFLDEISEPECFIDSENAFESRPLLEQCANMADDRIDDAFRNGFHSELDTWHCFAESNPEEAEAEKRRQRNRRKRARRKR